MTRPTLMTVAEVAAELRVSRTHMYDRLRSEDIPTVKSGRAIRIPSWWVAEQVDRRAEVAS